MLSQNNPRDIDNAMQKDMDEIEKIADEIGDIWLIRDRGAQAICSQKCACLMHQKISKLSICNNINGKSTPFLFT